MSFLQLKNVHKSFGSGSSKVDILSNINLEMEEGEFLAIVGFSGSGKTTLVNLISGLDTPTSGEVLLNGKKIDGPHPERAVVFQNYSLLPWLTVYGNIAMAVNQVYSSKSKKERDEIIKKHIEMVNLTPATNKLPKELSGGMRQRVSVARTLAMNPKILLMDEPLSALDALPRGNLQDSINDIWQADQKTVLLITNDVDEAIYLADRIIPMNPGPNATLGPEFKVNIPRPRDKADMNKMPEFKKLRNDVAKYLISVGEQVKKTNTVEYTLPNIKPKHLKAS